MALERTRLVMNDTEWHLVIEISKALITPLLAILGYFLQGMMKSMKQLEEDISQIKNSIGIHTTLMDTFKSEIKELKDIAGKHDSAFIDFYKEMRGYPK